MILRDYFETLDKEAVLDEIERLYPNSHRESYSNAWDEIALLTPEKILMTIVVDRFYEEYDGEIEDWIDVYGEDPDAAEDEFGKSGTEIKWALDFMDWTRWISMEVDVRTDCPRCSSPEKVMAHILWEMTFCGYSRDEVHAEKAILDERVAEVDKWVKEGTLHLHTISFEDVLKELKIEDLSQSINNTSEDDTNTGEEK